MADLPRSKRLDDGKKLSQVDHDVYQSTGMLPDGFQEAPPHELGDTYDWSQDAPPIQRYDTRPEILARILAREMEGESTTYQAWSTERREDYFNAFPTARPGKAEDPDEPQMVIRTGEEMRLARQQEGEVREEKRKKVSFADEDDDEGPPLDPPGLVSWAKYGLDQLMTLGPDHFKGSGVDRELKVELSNLVGKHENNWAKLLKNLLGLRRFNTEDTPQFRVETYYQPKPLCYLALLFEKTRLMKFFFIETRTN